MSVVFKGLVIRAELVVERAEQSRNLALVVNMLLRGPRIGCFDRFVCVKQPALAENIYDTRCLTPNVCAVVNE